MKIREVTYKRLFSFGHYQKESIGYTAELEQDEAPEKVLEALMKQATWRHHENQRIREEEGVDECLGYLHRDTYNILGQDKSKYHELVTSLLKTGYTLLHLEKAVSRTEKGLQRLTEKREKEREARDH